MRTSTSTPTFRLDAGSEWYPERFDYDEVGDVYDDMLLRKRADQRGLESLTKRLTGAAMHAPISSEETP